MIFKRPTYTTRAVPAMNVAEDKQTGLWMASARQAGNRYYVAAEASESACGRLAAWLMWNDGDVEELPRTEREAIEDALSLRRCFA